MSRIDLCAHLQADMKQDLWIYKRKDRRRIELCVCTECKNLIEQSRQNKEL